MASSLDKLGRFTAHRRVWIVAFWGVLLLGVLLLAATKGGTFVDDYTVPGTESQEASDLLDDRFPSAGGSSGQIVFHARTGDVSAEKSAVEQSVKNFAALPHVTDASDPFAAGAGTVSKDGSTAYSNMTFDELPQSLESGYLDRMDTAVEPARKAGLAVDYGAAAGQVDQQVDDHTSEAIGIAAAIIILILGFRAAVAAGLPVVTAGVSVATGVAGLSLLAIWFTLPTVSPAMSTMLGLGVGIDYALFILTRHREHLLEGVSPARSLGASVATAGHAVLVAGCTVVIAILGLYVSGVPLVGTLGACAAFVVAIAVAAALTLLPALLSLVGRWVLPRKARDTSTVPTTSAAAGVAEEDVVTAPEHPHGWARWAASISKRPVSYTVIATIVLLVLAIPLLSMRLGFPDAGSDPTSQSDRRAYDLITKHFGAGYNGPLTTVVTLDRSDPSKLKSDAQQAADAAGKASGVDSVSPPTLNNSGNTAVFTVVPTTSPQASGTTDLVNSLRDSTLPDSLKGTGTTNYVTGQTAGYVDFSAKMSQRLPWLIAGVLALAFLLLLAVFRSLVLATKAVILNLLSVGAAYGVVVAVFQWGWGTGLVGLSEAVPVVAYVPMMMFAIVFGLSMDYEVFLLSRIKEGYEASGDNLHSVAHGLAKTARVISSAAAIMICVFGSFVLQTNTDIKMLGLGLAFAVLIDATVVRLVLVPSTMTLLGHLNWWIPHWLDRILPHLDVEPAAAQPGAGAAAPPGPPPGSPLGSPPEQRTGADADQAAGLEADRRGEPGSPGSR